MQTRITFREHKAAFQAVQELVSLRLKENRDRRLRPEEPLSLFADFCFEAAEHQPLNGWGEGVLPKLQVRLGNVIRRSIAASGSKPDWSAKVEAVMHLCERALGSVSSEFLRGVPDPQTEVHRRRSLPCGTYSTPGFVVDNMCTELLESFPRALPRGLRIADLSMELGHFPLSLLRLSTNKAIDFYGMDRDKTALDVAKKLFEYASQHSTNRNVRLLTANVDSVLEEVPKGWPRTFDAVIGNPPWKTRHETDGPRYREAFKACLRGQFDVYLAFILRANHLLKPNGILSMVVPCCFLFNQNAEHVRDMLLREYNILSLRVYPRRTFVELPSVTPISFLARKGDQKRWWTTISYENCGLGGPNRPQSARKVRANLLWSALPRKVFHPRIDERLLFLLKFKTGTRLLEQGVLIEGAQFGKEAPVAPRRAFIGFNGKNLRRFHACERHAMEVAANAAIFGKRPPVEHIDSEKVLFQKTRCVTLPARLVSALVGKGGLAISAASMFVPKEQQHARFFEAFLNSHFANAWEKLHDVNRAISLSALGEMPMILDKRQWIRVADLGAEAARIRRWCHTRCNSCTVALEAQVFGSRFPRMWEKATRIMHEIDQEVFDLFDLNAKQRKLLTQFSLARIF